MVRDLFGLPDAEKYAVYDVVEGLRTDGVSVRTREDPSGFPAIRVYVAGRLAYMADCLSLEEWHRARTGTKHFIVSARNLRISRGVDAEDAADAVARIQRAVGHRLAAARAREG